MSEATHERTDPRNDPAALPVRPGMLVIYREEPELLRVLAVTGSYCIVQGEDPPDDVRVYEWEKLYCASPAHPASDALSADSADAETRDHMAAAMDGLAMIDDEQITPALAAARDEIMRTLSEQRGNAAPANHAADEGVEPSQTPADAAADDGVRVPLGASVTVVDGPDGEVTVIGGTDQVAILEDEAGQHHTAEWDQVLMPAVGPAFLNRPNGKGAA